MSCCPLVAVAALRRGHVTWEQLHPNVRERLTGYGFGPNLYEQAPNEAERHPLQHGEKA